MTPLLAFIGGILYVVLGAISCRVLAIILTNRKKNKLNRTEIKIDRNEDTLASKPISRGQENDRKCSDKPLQ